MLAHRPPREAGAMMVTGERLEGPRLLAHPLARAVVATVAERGYEAAGVEEIAARAQVGAEEFERLFADKADAVLRVLEAYIEDFKGRLTRAYREAGVWPASLRAAAYETVGWIEEHPDGAHFGMVDVMAAGEMARVRREETFRWCAELIDAGREVAPDPAAVPEAAALIAAGAVVELLARREAGLLDADMRETVPQLMYGAVRPYLGEEAALRELEIPPPDGRR